jgi:hypothetical protein
MGLDDFGRDIEMTVRLAAGADAQAWTYWSVGSTAMRI